MKTNNNKTLIVVALAIFFLSCDSKRVYDSYSTVKNQSWEINKEFNFSFQVKDTLTRNNLFVTIRNNNDYPFSNLFLITKLYFPDGKKIVDTLEYEMADSSGRFLGKGLSEIKESKLFYKENVIFPVSGEYVVSVSQAMRRSGEIKGIERLIGVTDVGFRIEKN